MAITDEGDFCAPRSRGVAVVHCPLLVFDLHKSVVICEVGVGLSSDKSIPVVERQKMNMVHQEDLSRSYLTVECSKFTIGSEMVKY